MGVARDVGFRMPSVWLAEGHSTVAPVYLYRFDFATPMLKLLRIAATHAKPTGLPGEPEWLPYQDPDRACLLIDRQDTVASDIDTHIAPPGAPRYSISGSPDGHR